MRLVSCRYGCGNGHAIAVRAMAMAIVFGLIGAPVAITGAAAQDAQEAEQKAPQVEPKGPAALPTPRPMVPIPSLKNIQVEITIIDQVGSDPPLKKTLSVIAADHGSGSVRSRAAVPVPRNPNDPKDVIYQDLPLNVDIRPEITENKTRIRARLILNYETLYASKPSGVPPVKSIVFVDQHVMLDSGKPMIVSQSADATTDRKVSVELKATILP
jgi:hypothetical protein